MLAKKKITDPEKRFKCACLALTAAVLVPTSHITKIVPEHVELIRDIDEFLSYPWGRIGFDLLVSSIKSKDEVELSQKTIAVKGFFYAIQLVMMAAVPTLTEVVLSPSGESESEGEDDSATPADLLHEREPGSVGDDTGPGGVKMTLSPGHPRELDEDCKVLVHCIIPDVEDCAIEGMDLQWDDEVEDGTVDVMVKLIEEGFRFSKDMFTGGLTSADLARMRSEKALKEKEIRDKKKIIKSAMDPHSLSLNNRLRDVEVAVLLHEGKLSQVISGFFKSMEASIVRAITDSIGSASTKAPSVFETRHESDFQNQRSHPSSPTCPSQTQNRRETHEFTGVPSEAVYPQQIDSRQSQSAPTSINLTQYSKAPSLAISDEEFIRGITQSINATGDLLLSVSPSFSLGLTQDGKKNSGIPYAEEEPDYLNDKEAAHEEDPPRKSKRLKSTCITNYKDYHRGVNCSSVRKIVFAMPCDPKVNYGEKFVELKAKLMKDRRPMGLYEGASISTSDVIDIGERVRVLHSTVVDGLMYYLRHISGPQLYPANYMKIEFYNTIFPVLIKSHYTKFTKTAVKDRSKFKFQPSLMSYFQPENPMRSLPEYMYFPFNFDQRHWVGVCVNLSSASIIVLDCNASLRSDSALKKEFTPLTNMFPYLLRAYTSKALRDEKPFTLVRAAGIPQNEINSNSAVTALFLMQAHASGGLDYCRTITPEVICTEAYKLAVLFYEEFGPQ
ncbi:hypothetical protein EUTSA_v10009967mg [Eutrema salsugineum]|uniref:Ubiquitin-like protease family profile domain-containing protein n=1 Tax=Eutrema salsugineum TaxID=72664 RepID=V4KX88_EUTSA|nr:hypothetical protein EUTSA_v10009967mg [Eutrema salsugineum]